MMMNRATLRLELLRIAHHHQQSTEVTLTIVQRYEEAFGDIAIEEDHIPPPLPKPAKIKP